MSVLSQLTLMSLACGVAGFVYFGLATRAAKKKYGEAPIEGPVDTSVTPQRHVRHG